MKSGNAVILKGGRDDLNSNRALVKLMEEALRETEIPEDAIQFIDTSDRAVTDEILKLSGYLDVIIPRGGKGLIKHVTENSHVPVIQTGASVVHIYVDREFDIQKAVHNRKQNAPFQYATLLMLCLSTKIPPFTSSRTGRKFKEHMSK